MRPLLPFFIVLAACNTPQTRTVQGQLTGTTGQALVLSETTSGDQTVTQVGPDGTFTLQMPTQQPVTLLVAVPNGTGTVNVVRHIGPAWFTVSPGPVIRLGRVSPEGTVTEQATPVGQATPQQCPSMPGRAELPYDAKLSVGQTWRLADAFAEKGAQPARVVGVTMDGSTWHLAELQSGAAFTVTQADCDHAGNRDTGRDRAVITWENADGSRETDHLDLRYCEGGSSSGGSSSSSDDSGDDSSDDSSDIDEDAHHDCAEVHHEGCGSSGSRCDDDSQLEAVEVAGAMSCPGQGSSSTPR